MTRERNMVIVRAVMDRLRKHADEAHGRAGATLTNAEVVALVDSYFGLEMDEEPESETKTVESSPPVDEAENKSKSDEDVKNFDDPEASVDEQKNEDDGHPDTDNAGDESKGTEPKDGDGDHPKSLLSKLAKRARR